MKSRVVWLGLAAFLLAMVVVLPMRWIAGALPAQLHCNAWSGSVWHGQCSGLTILQPGQEPLPIELLQWKLHPLALFRLSLRADFSVRTAQGTGSGTAELGRNGRIGLENVSAVATFDRRLATMLAPGWTGQLTAEKLAVRVQGNQLQALSGDLTLRDFNDGRGGALGNYALRFAPVSAPPFVGVLKDIGGPFEVGASLTIQSNRQWRLDGKLAARSGAPASLMKSMEILGAPDAAGRYPLVVEGSFK
jgi:hypothetical protein